MYLNQRILSNFCIVGLFWPALIGSASKAGCAAGLQSDLLDELRMPTRLSDLKATARETIATIEEHLGKRIQESQAALPDDDAGSLLLLAEAKRWLGRLRAKSGRFMEWAERKGRRNSLIIELLELFVALERTKDNCSRESLRAIANNCFVLGIGSSNEDDDAAGLIGRTIREHALAYAKHCAPSYELNFEKSYANLKRDDLHLLDSVLDDQFLQLLAATGNSSSSSSSGGGGGANEAGQDDYDNDLIITKNLDALNVYDRSVNNELKSRIGRVSGKRQTTRDGLIELDFLEDYLLDPCHKFVRHLRDIFLPARFVALLQHKKALLGKSRQFIKRWKQYRACCAYFRADNSRLVVVETGDISRSMGW